MHRIDSATATSDHKFTEGDPTIPIAATTVTADWLNAVQEEIAAVIAGAKKELDKSDNAQLYAAITSLITTAKPGIATSKKTGLVQIGSGLSITAEGLLSVLTATTARAGIVQLAGAVSASATETPTYKGVKDAIDEKFTITLPIGGIVAFSGTFGGEGNRFPIPLGAKQPDTNWVLCDGTETNGHPVPDLRGRMILGASESHQIGDTGGSETHTHSLSGTVGATTLTVAQLATHKHTIKNSKYKYGSNGEGQYGFDTYFPLSSTSNLIDTTGGSQSHTHSLSGASKQANSLPPYYALALIMRIA